MTGAMTELTGWVPATVLLATMGRQVYPMARLYFAGRIEVAFHRSTGSLIGLRPV